MRHVVRWTTKRCSPTAASLRSRPHKNGQPIKFNVIDFTTDPLTTQGGTPFNKLGDQVGQGLVGTLAMLGAGLLFMNRRRNLALVGDSPRDHNDLAATVSAGCGSDGRSRWSASARATAGYTLRDTRGAR